jgi:AcrR family transcriptional regulator
MPRERQTGRIIDPMARTPTRPTTDEEPRWQQRALDRSLNAAREKSLARSSKFLASAIELLNETGRVDFTVQNLVERSQLSLRAFYQHFGGKDDLVLAVFEELTGVFVESLAKSLDEIEDPFERLATYTRRFLQRAHESRESGGRAVTIYLLHLALDRPDDYARATSPQVELLETVIRHGVAAGLFRTDIPTNALAHLVNSTLVSFAQTDVFDIQSGAEVSPDHVWAWCETAVRPPAEGGTVRTTTGLRRKR